MGFPKDWMPYRVIKQDSVQGTDARASRILVNGDLECSIGNLFTAFVFNYAPFATYRLKPEEKNEENLVPISFGPGIYKKGEFPGSKIKEIHRPIGE